MTDHRRSVHRDRKYQCDSCGSTFKNSSTLKSHVVSIHTTHDKKPLRCGECGKGFLHESRLKAHELIHSDAAPFSCQYCGRPNKCKNNNLKHEKRCKKAAGNASKVNAASTMVITKPTDTESAAAAIIISQPNATMAATVQPMASAVMLTEVGVGNHILQEGTVDELGIKNEIVITN